MVVQPKMLRFQIKLSNKFEVISRIAHLFGGFFQKMKGIVLSCIYELVGMVRSRGACVFNEL
jgi:hypothetical protein